MPNHCENTLTVSGLDLEDFMRSIIKIGDDGKVEIDILQTHFPCPQELIDTPSGSFNDEEVHTHNLENYGSKNWYDWCIKNWSTKWGDYDGEFISDNMLRFQSAWAPPVAGFDVVSKKFPALEFTLEYYEGGMGFYGRAYYHNGLVNDICMDIEEWICPKCESKNVSIANFYDSELELECLDCQHSFMEEAVNV